MDDLAGFKARFGAKLRILRDRRGLRLVDLEDYGINVRGYQRAEQGEVLPRVTTLLLIAKAFQVRPYELLKVEDVEPDALRVSRGGRRLPGLPGSRAQRGRRQRRQPATQRRS